MEKQKLVVLMNCAGLEIMRHANSSQLFLDKFNCEFFSSYELNDTERKNKFTESAKTADVILTQNIKKVEGLTYDEVVNLATRKCHIIKIEYWRFDGFWPISLPTAWPGFWFLPSELGFPKDGSFDEYMSLPIDRQLIKDNFEAECDRLHKIDLLSDIKIYPLFERSYVNKNTFSDYNHPCSFLFHHVTNIILEMLGIDEKIPLLSNHGINDNRHRLILNNVYDTLGLKFDRDNICYFGNKISQKEFFEFSQFLMSNPPADPALPFHVEERFKEFYGSKSV